MFEKRSACLKKGVRVLLFVKTTREHEFDELNVNDIHVLFRE